MTGKKFLKKTQQKLNKVNVAQFDVRRTTGECKQICVPCTTPCDDMIHSLHSPSWLTS